MGERDSADRSFGDSGGGGSNAMRWRFVWLGCGSRRDWRRCGYPSASPSPTAALYVPPQTGALGNGWLDLWATSPCERGQFGTRVYIQHTYNFRLAVDPRVRVHAARNVSGARCKYWSHLVRQ